MRRTLLLVFTFLLVSGGGAYYWFFVKNRQIHVWSFVPSDAIAVYESKNILSALNNASEKKIWKNLSNLPALKRLENQLLLLDSIGQDSIVFTNMFKDNQVLISFHNSSRYSIGTLLSLEVKDVKSHDYLSRLITHFKDRKDITIGSRVYLGHQVTELSSMNSTFTYIFYKNFFIGSFTPFLVEDAIRTVSDVNFPGFSQSHNALFQLNSLELDEGNIYFNGSKLKELVATFLDPLAGNVSNLNQIMDHALLDISISDDHLSLTGFSVNDLSENLYLQTYDSSQSRENIIMDVVPENTAALIHYSFEDFKVWHHRLKLLWRTKFPERLTYLGELENRYGLDLNKMYSSIGDQLALMHMQPVGTSQNDLILCLTTSDQNTLSDHLFQIATAASAGQIPYEEKYKGKTIRQIEIPEIPERLFGPMFNGFNSTFFMDNRGHLFLGNSVESLKSLVDYIDRERTWNKSVKVNNFLDITNKEANISFIINTSKALNLISNKLNSEWKEVWSENLDVFRQIEYMAFQFTNIDDKYYTNIAFQHPGQLQSLKSNIAFETIRTTQLDEQIITRPYAVRNHTDQTLEMIVQDTSYQMNLVSVQGELLWKKQLANKIIGNVYQVDYYKNNKLQYLFSTQDAIHIIDRTGTYVPGYPLQLPSQSKISKLSLIDYDNSKNYRIMVATRKGQYYLHDKSGRRLEGWNPNDLAGIPAMPGEHLRIRNRDHLIFLSERGVINVLNRRGNARRGFPVNLNSSVRNPVFINRGTNDENTTLSVLLDEGVIIDINLRGQTTKREHIYKATTNDQYKLAISSNKRSFVILRFDENSASILDQDGKELFQHVYAPSDEMGVKYYNFGNNNEIIIITDRLQEVTYLYDKNGNLMHHKPLNTGHDISLLYYENENMYRLYTTFENQLHTLSLSR